MKLTPATPIDCMALEVVPLLVEARRLFEGTGLMADSEADEEICRAFDALYAAADKVSYRLWKKAKWKDGEWPRELMNRIDDALDEIRDINHNASDEIREIALDEITEIDNA